MKGIFPERKNHTSESVAEFEAGKLLVRLIRTFGEKETLDELLYKIACQKLVERRS